MRLLSSLRRLLTGLLLSVLVAVPLAGAPAHARSALPLSSTTLPAVTPDVTFPIAVGDRDALVSLPAGYDPAVAWPVILAFGGWGVSPEQMASDTGLRDATDAIVVYARGHADSWAGAPYAVTSTEQDVAYARAIVDTLSSQYTVNRARVYAVGHSDGGAFALSLACRAPDLVAGVVSVSGMFYDPIDAGCVGAPVPVKIIHAANDDVALVDGGVRHHAPFLSTRALLDRWALRNGCLPLTHPSSTSAPDATLEKWVGCHAETEYLLSRSAGHGWPDHAAREAWAFLSTQFR